MNSRNSTSIPEIRELRSDESDEFVTLMELAFKDSIEEGTNNSLQNYWASHRNENGILCC